MNGENIVGHPSHVRRIFSDQPFDFIDDKYRTTPAVRLAIDLVAAPAALIGAAARRDERHRSFAVSVTPGANIPPHVNGLPIRPRLCVQVGDLHARYGLMH
jgi:hypothetical protein